jgi:hypothetical protein
VNVGYNRIGKAQVLNLVSIFKQQDQMKSVGFAGCDLGVDEAKAVADYVSVSGGLTSLNLSDNQLCGLDMWGNGTYNAEGITAIADALRVNGALTRVDVRCNSIAGDGAAQLSAAVLGNLKIEMYNEIPIKEMRANSLTELDLKGKGVGVEGGMVVAGLIPVMGALTSLDLSGNQLCGLDDFGDGTYTAEVITAIADALRVNGGLTALDLSSNRLKDEGVSAVCEAIQSNKETKLASLNFKDNGIGPVGSKSVAAMVAVTGALTEVLIFWSCSVPPTHPFSVI